MTSLTFHRFRIPLNLFLRWQKRCRSRGPRTPNLVLLLALDWLLAPKQQKFLAAIIRRTRAFPNKLKPWPSLGGHGLDDWRAVQKGEDAR
jgi:hypothetical protein